MRQAIIVNQNASSSKIKTNGFCKKTNGFTLIELMISVLIIGIISALAIPRFARVTAKVRKKEAFGILRQIYVLETAYYMSEGHYQVSSAVNVIPHIGYREPSYKRRYDYTVRVGLTGNIKTSVHIVATEIQDADIDGIPFESIIMDEEGAYLGDWAE